jgi:glycosyltransferase involved in cell wall biosynthesis
MKLCIFPNDPIIAYYNKGEIKERYYNPNNFFNEIHIISFIIKDIEESKVQILVGNAKLFIHSVGKITYFNKEKKKREVIKLINEINPDIIRAYNPFLEGWIAAHCSKELNIPFFVSLHVQYDQLRKLLGSRNYKKKIALKYSEKIIEPFVLKTADKITAVYKIIEPYVMRMCNKHPEILYNRIELKRFANAKKNQNFNKPLIITVGRLTPQKNHEILIKSIKGLDIYLMIIGNGEQKEYLKKLTKEMKLESKVIFKDSVPNDKIQDYYKSADLFALAYDPKIEGLPIPVLEAMATGLPVIIPHPINDLSDGLENFVEFADLNQKSFSLAIKKIFEDKSYSDQLSKLSLKKSKEFDGDVTEKKEAGIYYELLSWKK